MRFRQFIPLLTAVVLLAACDASEDPYLLNPPLPDSTHVRVVNLVEGEQIEADLPVAQLATHLPPFTISSWTSILQAEQTFLMVGRTGEQDRDTLNNQILARGARLTYLVLDRGDTSLAVVPVAVGRQDAADLTSRGVGSLLFVNAVEDSAVYYLRRGCSTGDTLVQPLAYGSSSSVEVTTASQSIYLYSSADSLPVATARLATPPGSITHLVAARRNGVVELFQIGLDAALSPLQTAEPETRTTATVSLLNGVADGVAISARMERGSTIASGLLPLALSAPATVEACPGTSGGRVVVSTASGDTTSIPLRLTVGGRVTVVVYGSATEPKALTLDLSDTAGGDRLRLRGVNLAPSVPAASLSLAVGGPDSARVESRPFGTLVTGTVSGRATLKPGRWPILLSNAATGDLLDAGLETFASGRHTLLIVEQQGVVGMYVLDEEKGTPPTPLDEAGVPLTLFNLLPDKEATFTVGGTTLLPLAYGYVFRSVLPVGVTSITTPAGAVTVDPGLGGHIVGVTRGSSGERAIGLTVDASQVTPGKASVRFLNLVAEGRPLLAHESSVASPTLATMTFGEPSTPLQLDPRKYTFVFNSEEDQTVVARTEGVEVVSGRRYLVLVGPKRSGSSSELPYAVHWMQE